MLQPQKCHLWESHSCSRGCLKIVSMCSSRRSRNIYVALSCGIKGLEGSATGASMSIDIVEPDDWIQTDPVKKIQYLVWSELLSEFTRRYL